MKDASHLQQNATTFYFHSFFFFNLKLAYSSYLILTSALCGRKKGVLLFIVIIIYRALI